MAAVPTRLALSIALLGSAAGVQAEIAGPLPLVVGSYVGVIREGETDHIMCTLTYCPQTPVCTLEEVDLRAALQVLGSANDRITIMAEDWFGAGIVSATAMGPTGTAEITAHQGDSCLEVWVVGTHVEFKRTAYVVKIEHLRS